MKATFASLALLIPALLCTSSCQGRKKGAVKPFGAEMIASESEVTHVDEHYRFSIRGLGPQWRALDEKQRASILPDAAALVTKVGGTYGAVIVEPYPEANLRNYTDLIFSNMQSMIPSLKAEEEREMEFNGGTAHRRKMSAKIKGIEFDYELMTFLHQGMGYQVLAWMPVKTAGREPLEEFIAAVKIDEGKVTTPPPPQPPDSTGIGNRISNGRFESATSGLSATPSGPWTLAWGKTLESMDDNLETGIQRPDLGIYISASDRLVAPGEEIRFVNSLDAAIAEGAKRLGTTTWTFGGEPVKFTSVLLPGPPQMRMHLGRMVKNGRGIQIKAWHLDHGGTDHTPLIGEGMAAFEFLNEKEKEELRATLLKTPDRVGSVGENYSVRNGVYRDFSEGVIWQRPEGFWKIEAGEAAQLRNDATSLYAKELTSGLTMQLVVQEPKGMNPQEFHQAVVSVMEKGGFSPGSKPLEPIMVDGCEVLRTRLLYEGKDTDIEYHVATVIVGDRAYQLNSFAPAGLMTGQMELVSGTLTGFSFPGKKLRAVECRGGIYRDVRMGYELRVKNGMSPEPQTKENILSNLGSTVQFRRKSEMIYHMALQADGQGNDASTAVNMVNQIFKLNLDRASAAGSSETPDTIADLPATVRSGASDGAYMKIVVFRQGGVLHMGTMMAPTKSKLEALFADYKSGFSLIP
jgi:hypothetical protein